jgi:hypothetical protein
MTSDSGNSKGDPIKFLEELYEMEPNALFKLDKAKALFWEKEQQHKEEAEQRKEPYKEAVVNSPMDILNTIDPGLKSSIDVAADIAGYTTLGKKGETVTLVDTAIKEALALDDKVFLKHARKGEKAGQKPKEKSPRREGLYRLAKAIKDFVAVVLKRIKKKNVDKKSVSSKATQSINTPESLAIPKGKVGNPKNFWQKKIKAETGASKKTTKSRGDN